MAKKNKTGLDSRVRSFLLKNGYNYLGLMFASVGFCLSLLPSLLPRPWLLQGVVSGISMAVAYGIGTLSSKLFRWFSEYKFPEKTKQIVWRASLPLLALSFVLFLILGRSWQNEVSDIIGAERASGPQVLLGTILTFLVFLLFIKISRSVVRLYHYADRKLSARVPKRISAGIGIVAAGLVTYGLVSGVLLSGLLTLANKAYSTRDHTAPEDIVQPQSEYRSGGSESHIPWDEIGYQGRGFVGSGPTVEQITEFTDKEAKEPIRLYAGLASASTPDARAELIVEELKRTNAFDREVLVIATATGTGWLDPSAVDALEFMYDGDTAIVSQQYSYLPSWISFLVDKEKAHDAGRALYDAVYGEWLGRPEQTRPKLLIYGLSLGSFGSQAAFSGINDISRSTDGALYAGTPNESVVWRNTTDNRDEGSPEWQPTYRGGKNVRFAAYADDIYADQSNWQTDQGRILFMQHGNDPVVWFSFDLIFHKPDWLSEERGAGVSPKTKWYPIITFLQVGLDQAVAGSAPYGSAHYYVDTTAHAWGGILPPDNWNRDYANKLQNYINSDFKSARYQQ